MGDGRKLEKENECKKQRTCAACKSKLPMALRTRLTLIDARCGGLIAGLKFNNFGLVSVITFDVLAGLVGCSFSFVGFV